MEVPTSVSALKVADHKSPQSSASLSTVSPTTEQAWAEVIASPVKVVSSEVTQKPYKIFYLIIVTLHI